MSTEIEYPPETAASLLSGILGDLQHLVEQQFQLTRREIEEELRQRAAAAAMFGLGMGVFFLDAIVLCLTLAHLLHWMTSPSGTDPASLPLWACYGVVAVVLAVGGGILGAGWPSQIPVHRLVSESSHRDYAGASPMNDTPEVIRQQMEETKSHLSEKLVSLETQVTETVQSTGTAVNATVEAVQETVETVTGAVQGAVQSVSNAFDLRRQVERHPLLVLGGAAVLGYLAVDFLTGRAKKSKPLKALAIVPCPSVDNASHENGVPAVESVATAAAITAAYESGLQSSSRHQLQDLAFRALIGVVQDIATHAVPQVVDYLTGSLAGDRIRRPEETGEASDSPARKESTEAAQRLRLAPSESVRTGNSF